MTSPPIDRLDDVDPESAGQYQVYTRAVSVALSITFLLWESRVSSCNWTRPQTPGRRHVTSWAAVNGTLEGILLLASLNASWGGVSTGGLGSRWGENAFWSYAFGLYLLRLLPAPGFDYIRRAAWQHSFLLVTLSWALSLSTLPSDAEAYIIPCSLLATMLFSQGPAAPSNDALDATGEYSSSMIGFLSFSWMDEMLFSSWKRGRLGAKDVPMLSIYDRAATNVADFLRARSVHTTDPGGREGRGRIRSSLNGMLCRSPLQSRLVRQFAPELVAQGLLAALSGVLVFLPTLLLGLVLQYVEDTRVASARQATYYVILLFLASILISIGQGHASWMGQKTGLRIRSVLTSEVYQKVLCLPFAPKMSTASSSPTDAGAVMNFFTADVNVVASSGSNVHQIWASVPAQIFTSLVLLYQTLGPSSLVGVALMALMVPVNSRIAQQFGAIQGRVMTASDARIQSTTELLRNIRVIKLLAWEPFFCRQIGDKRSTELRALRARYILWSLAATIWYSVPLLITFSSFFAYSVIAGRSLTPSLAFKSLSLFNLLKIPLDDFVGALAQIQTTLVSLKRLDTFLGAAETDKYRILGDHTRRGDVGFDNATFAWPSAQSTAGPGLRKDSQPVQDSCGFMLRDLDVKFFPARLNVVIGSTGSGKSSMLLALLGEMPLVRGQVHMGDAPPEKASKVGDEPVHGVALCAQEPWMMNDTVRNNVLFGKTFDQKRYEAVIDACALRPDLKVLSAGDSSTVGEGGVSLSGGQKQRVALARAVYSGARHVLLDDCLSAVDSHTASWIFERCIRGELMKDRTCILVTNNTQLAVPAADFVVKLENGAVVAAGSPQHLWDQGYIPEVADPRGDRRAQPVQGHEEPSSDRVTSQSLTGGQQEQVPSEATSAVHGGKAGEGTRGRSIRTYLTAMGGRGFWVLLTVFFVAQQAGSMMTNWWVRELSNAYADAELGRLDAPNLFYYFGVYVIFLFGYIGIGFMRLFTLSLGSLAASVHIHDSLLQSITSATLRFFGDRTFGRLINVFANELRTVDQDLAVLAIATLHFAGALVGISALIAFITPAFLIPGIFIGIGYYLISTIYVTASRDLKTMQSDYRSPLLQHLGETLSGVLTIRAYGAERRYFTTTLARLDNYNQISFFVEGAERWLVLRLGLAGAFVSLFAGLFAVNSTGSLSAGTIGLSLTYAIVFSEHVLWLVRYHAANAQNMTALEQIQGYVDLPEGSCEQKASTEPPQGWPSQGVVEYKNVSARYAASLDDVLCNLTFRIDSREKVGIVGRTGAGKSSFVLTLLRGLEVDEGSILIDDVDTHHIGLGSLRKSLAYVPQDPTLFAGSLRINLDPFQEHSDGEILESLRQVGLLHYAGGGAQLQYDPDRNKLNDLSFTLLENGSNISQGQRQLICIARALLKQSRIIILDEATASVDLDSDIKIQACMRSADSTVITVAHRLATVIDYDRIMVLDAGLLKEFGHPWQLLQRNDGIFKSMCDAAMDRKELKARAKAAWESK